MDISLRLPELSDAKIILAWENDPENWAVSDNEGEYELSDIEALIESFHSEEKPLQLRFLICSPTELLGAVDIFDINYENKSGAIGILIAKLTDRKKGVATTALRLMEQEARALGVDKLVASMYTINTASRRLFEKAGYNMVKSPRQVSNEQDLILVEKWINVDVK